MATKPQKEVTLVEFKAWLEGMEELQPRDWAPTAKQWKIIRAKIKKIVTPMVKNPPTHTPDSVHVPIHKQPVSTPSALGIPPAPIVDSSGFPPNVQIEAPSPEATNLLTGDKRKTPDLDTSDGNYASTFI